jgi:hypothetical protein
MERNHFQFIRGPFSGAVSSPNYTPPTGIKKINE